MQDTRYRFHMLAGVRVPKLLYEVRSLILPFLLPIPHPASCIVYRASYSLQTPDLHCGQRKDCICHLLQMYQVNFSEQSMRELNSLEKWDQMPLIEKLSSLTQHDLENMNEDLGRFNRNGKTYYRLRAGDYRIYFELKADSLYSHYILHQHTLTDFIFRFKLPVNEEQLIEQHQSFWKYLETLRK